MLPADLNDSHESTDDTRPARRWLLVRSSGSVLGLPADRVREIVPGARLARLPHAPAGIAGLAALRGRILTVVDLGACVDAPRSAARPEHQLAVLDWRDRPVALAVDEAWRIATVPEGALEPSSLPDDGKRALALTLGTARDGEGSFLALDLERLLGELLGEPRPGAPP